MSTAISDFDLFLGEVGLTHDDLKDVEVKVMPDHNDGIYLAPSDIAGIGVFAGHDFYMGDVVGLSRSNDAHWTPLGRYTNHSKDANCRVIRDDKRLFVLTQQFIREGTELTLNYRQVRETISPL